MNSQEHRERFLTLYDERSTLCGFLPRANAVLVDAIFDILQFLQSVQIGRLPLLLQLFATDVRIRR